MSNTNSDYISREAAIKKFHDELYGGYVLQDDAQTTRIINEIPTANVRPVVQGNWIMHLSELFPEDSTMECDQCHEEQPLTCDDNFCPHCGADMRPAGKEVAP